MKSNRVIIVPDVHGRQFWRSVLNNTEDTIVFLGDYGDPYYPETHEDTIKELTDIVEFKKNNLKRVILLIGNHDLFYINKIFESCRHGYKQYEQYERLIKDNLDLFKTAIQIKQNDQWYLFTHAGVTEGWVNDVELNKYSAIGEPEDALNKLAELSNYIPFGMISMYRGGHYRHGSPMWADINEHDTIGAFPDYIQIFGHTQQKSDPIINGNMWCLDCRKVFVLENNELKEYVESY